MSQSIIRDGTLLRPVTNTEGSLLSSQSPFQSSRGDRLRDVELSRHQSPELQNVSVDSRFEMAEEQSLQYEGDADLWSQSDEMSLTDEETIPEQDTEHPASASDKFSRQEKLRMLALRRHLDALSIEVARRESLVQTTREELNKCRETVASLEAEQDEIYRYIEQSIEAGNTADVYRLESKHSKVCIELEAERELEMGIVERLAAAELELSKADIERGKFLLAEDELKGKEERLAAERRENAAARAEKEKLRASQVVKRLKGTERDHFEALKERDRKHRQAMSAAKKSQENVSKYIHETLSKVRQKKGLEEEQAKEHMERRMNTLLNLKGDITANRENLKARQARNRHLEEKAKQAEEREIQELKASGKNVQEVMLQRKRLQQIEDEKRNFHATQRQKQAALISGILEEEKQMKRRQKMYPQLFPDPKREKSMNVAPQKKKSIKLLEDIAPNEDYKIIEGESVTDDVPQSPVKEVLSADESSEEGDDFNAYGTTIDGRPGSQTKEGKLWEELAQPEFEGLWDKTHKPYKVPKDEEPAYTLNYPSKMEKEMMAAALDKHRAGIIRKQIAAGREFKGCPFVSKPSVVHFKDFDVGKAYKKKVILTNVSYSVNFLKMIDLSEHLKDFVDLQFEPPGQMSAGMSCDMLVTFKPLINEDLSGEVQFLAQTGPFSIPVKCSTKKCDVSVDTDSIDFGVQVIGETLKKSITLINRGAKGTTFEFLKITGMKQPTILSAGTSLGRMTTAEESIKPDSAPSGEETLPKPRGKSKQKIRIVEGNLPEAEESPAEDSPHPQDQDTPNNATEDTVKEESEMSKEEENAAPAAVAFEEEEDVSTLDGMRLGDITEAEIGPFKSVKLEVIYQPTVPGRVDVDFELRFANSDSDNIPIRAYANAIDVPVWVERQNVDLKICMFDRLYQDAIIINNRATSALRLTMEVCKELRSHLGLLPKTAYIQAQSQFSVQMKFLPRHTLSEDAASYFDKDTGVLEAPMTIRVADQTAPVPFTVHAVVTSSDLEFDRPDLDFGFCTIHESVTYTVQLTNKSILSQKYGFVGLPEYVTVQPNDGFGTLLPSETVPIDIIFNAEKAKIYSFELTCRSGINRDFKLSCKAVGVHTPLELSHSVIHFAATALGDASIASFKVINSHTDANEFTHPVPRVGKGPVAPVGPTSFEFIVPDGAPISVYPSVGTVKPGMETNISIKFSPELVDEEIRVEAVRLATKNLELKARQEYEAEKAARNAVPDPAEDLEDMKNKKGAKKPKSPAAKVKASQSLSGPKPVVPPKPEDISIESNEYSAGRSSLLRQFTGKFSSYTIPCFVASGIPGDPGTLPYDVNNTLYIHVHCPEVKPSLVVISNHGRTVKDFGEVSIGQRVVKSITVQNISDTSLDLEQSVLDCHGPFLVLNAIRNLAPDATHTLVVAFEPTQPKSFYEVLDIKCTTSTLSIILRGQGLDPLVKVSVTDGVLDMGYVLAGEEHTENVKLENSSTFPIDYRITLDSMKPNNSSAFIEARQSKKYNVGPANYHGGSVFDCIPCQGTLQPGKKVDIAVTFRPDHSSDLFADVARIELFGKQEGHVFQLKGAAKTKIMYVTGGDEIAPRAESLCITPAIEESGDATQSDPIPVLLTFRALTNEDTTQPAVREIHIGCVRTMAVSQKKNGEFFFDSLNTITALGFQIEPTKGMVDAGNTKKVTITWSPPKGHDPTVPLESSIILNLKGDTLEQHKINLHALVVTKEQDTSQ